MVGRHSIHDEDFHIFKRIILGEDPVQRCPNVIAFVADWEDDSNKMGGLIH
jgi:hypothetical protein